MIQEIEEIIGIPAEDAALVSAKTGAGRRGAARADLVKRIPAPKGDPEAPLQALIIDSWFDNYVGRRVAGAGDERRAAVRAPRSASCPPGAAT